MTFPYSEQNTQSRRRLEMLVRGPFRGGLRPLYRLRLDGFRPPGASRVLGLSYVRYSAPLAGGRL